MKNCDVVEFEKRFYFVNIISALRFNNREMIDVKLFVVDKNLQLIWTLSSLIDLDFGISKLKKSI